MKIIGKQKNSRMCFICGMDNPLGLKAQFYNMEDGSVMTTFCYHEAHQSFPKRVHGGLIAAMLDELGLRALWAKHGEDTFGVTVSLEVKYRKPVPYDETVIGKGILVKESTRSAVIKTELYDERGHLLSNADVVYLKAEPEKIVSEVNPHEEMCYLISDDLKEISFA